MAQVNAYRGMAGIAIKEISCDADIKLNKNNTDYFYDLFYGNENLTSNNENSSFASNFYLRIYSSGCYYLDEATNKWSSYGVEILEDSNLTHTHCLTNHLTSFAAGFTGLPTNTINFDYVFSNSSFEKNPVIYATVIAMCLLYVLLGIWAVYMDNKRDRERVGITLVNNHNQLDSDLENKYIYEIIVFTGNRKDSQTNSKVSLILSGDMNDSGILKLSESYVNDRNYKYINGNDVSTIEEDENCFGKILKCFKENSLLNRKPFRRGGVDSFILIMDRPIVNLQSIRVWHDNSGKATDRSWYLKHIIVHDFQTRDKFYFRCENWLAQDHSDGLLNRLLVVLDSKQKKQFKYLLVNKTKQSLSDGHLWFSIFLRPTQSSFTRLDRLTCCFVLLSLSMLVNIIYYGYDKSSSPNALVLDPFVFTPEQVILYCLFYFSYNNKI